jgi:hypothetical protein
MEVQYDCVSLSVAIKELGALLAEISGTSTFCAV